LSEGLLVIETRNRYAGIKYELEYVAPLRTWLATLVIDVDMLEPFS
jgi:hypothetical protein